MWKVKKWKCPKNIKRDLIFFFRTDVKLKKKNSIRCQSLEILWGNSADVESEEPSEPWTALKQDFTYGTKINSWKHTKVGPAITITLQ